MKTFSGKYISRVVLLSILAWTSVSTQADIVLHPGYLSGKFTIGDYNVYSANVSASGDGYSASRSVTGDSYSLTVEGGDWDYSVGANIYVRPTDVYYPYTRMYFNNRSIQIPIAETVVNNYSFGAGTSNAAATIRFQVNITGDAYTSWYGYAYALQNVDPSMGERTYSQSYTHSNYSTTDEWDMPVLPNDNVRIYAQVRVDSRWYYFWTSSTDYRYENIGAGTTLIVPLNIEHTIVDSPPPPPPPEYDYGKLQGTVELGISEPSTLYRHRVTASGRRSYSQYLQLDTNPSPYEFLNVQTDALDPYTYTLRAYTWFDSNQTYLQWPYTNGDPTNDQVVVEMDQTSTQDLVSETGVLIGDLTFSGSLADVDLNRYLNNYGASNFYDPATNTWERQSTYGGSARHYRYMGDSDTSYRLFLQPGPWLPYRVDASFSDSSQGYYQSYSLNIYDYNHYYDGNSYNFGVATDIEAGTTTIQDRDYCTGSVIVRFRDESGGQLSYPRLNGYGNRYNGNGNRELYVRMYGSSNITNALEPTIELHGPKADYNLYNIRFQAADGTNLSFPGFPITLECGVRKGVPISGKPEILVEQPSAYYLTNADSVTVSGTASDDNGIDSMTVNGNPVEITLTGNLDNEVSFSYDLPLADGGNTIVTTATDVDNNESFDERPVYVDRWQPSVTIVTPTDGAIFADPTATVPIEVLGSDQGYGFTVKLYYDGALISEGTGPGNQLAVESVTLSETIGPMTVGSHVILAEIIDDAGNSASHSITISTNTIPVAFDDAYSTPEDVPLNVAAPGVLGNDSDADGHSLSATLATPPTYGTLALNLDGAFSYTPHLNFHGTDSFTYTVADGFGGSAEGTVTLTVTLVNDPPVANDDSYSTNEDEPLTVAVQIGVLANDLDVEGDSLTSTLVTGPTNGTLKLNANGSFSYSPDQDFNGMDSFSYQASDAELQSNVASVNITVDAVNDPPVVSIDTVSQTAQYSDRIRTVTITAGDIDSTTLTLTPNGLPDNLGTAGGCTGSGDGSTCSWTLDGQTLVGTGTYGVSLDISDGEDVANVSTELIVVQENASAVFDDANPPSVRVAGDGGDSGSFELKVHVTEAIPDLPADLAATGDITLANVDISLVPVGPGGIVTETSCSPDDSVTGVRTVACSFNGVPVETYSVQVTIGGDYYTGSAENVLTVYDPSLGHTTGGGWFYWPDTSDKTNFGYTMKYGKKGTNVKGSLLLIRHLADGQKYRIKSNALSGLAIGQDPAVPYGWASFSGKSTYLEPGMPEPEGNHGFTVYVEDRNQPGSGSDRFWITTRDKDGSTIPAMSLPEPAFAPEPDYAVTIQGGNIVAPH